MKTYHKVPRYDHNFVRSEWVNPEQNYVLEKYDGSNFRFMIYDERYSDEYDLDFSPKHGEVVVGTKNVESCEADIQDSFDVTLKIQDRFDYLKETINIDKILKLHEYYDAPLVFFAENMIRHTLEYDWDKTPPLVIFDIYCYADDSDYNETIEHPYKEKFTGFLPWIDVVRISKYMLNIPFAHCVDTSIKLEELTEDSIKKSEYSDKRAEGYVIRNDITQRRIKIRTEDFKELNKKIWGGNIDGPTAKEIAYAYTTKQRVKKELFKLYTSETDKASTEILEQLVYTVTQDIWEEEWNEFCNKSFTPYQIYQYVAERIQGVLSRPNLFETPKEFENVVKKWNYSGDSVPESISPDNPVTYVYANIDESLLQEKYNDVCKNNPDREPGGWIIEPLSRKVTTIIWYQYWNTVSKINTKIDGKQINEYSYEIVVPFVKSKS